MIKMSLKKIIAGSLLGLKLLTSPIELEAQEVPDEDLNKIELHGSLGLGYLPEFTDDITYNNIARLGLDLYLDIPIKESALQIGGGVDTYMFLPGLSPRREPMIYFDPFRTSYDLFINFYPFKDRDLMFYLFHNCTHPVMDTEEWINNPYDDDYRIINHDSKTEIGFEYSF